MSAASSRLRRMRSALRTSASPYVRYAACGSLTASTLDADEATRAVGQVVAGKRTVEIGRARTTVVTLHALPAAARAAHAVVVGCTWLAVCSPVLVRRAHPWRGLR